MAPARRCALCRQTFFCGRGHVYSHKHRRQLKAALDRLLAQVRAAPGGPERAGGRRPARAHLGRTLSATGGGRPQGHPRGAGGAVRARARARLLVPVLWLRGAEAPEPRDPHRAARRAARTPGQVRLGWALPPARRHPHVGAWEEDRLCDLSGNCLPHPAAGG